MIRAFYKEIDSDQSLSLILDFQGYSEMEGDWEKPLRVLKGEKEAFEGSFCVGETELLGETKAEFAYLSCREDGVKANFEPKEGIDYSSLQEPLTHFVESSQMGEEGKKAFSDIVKTIYAGLKAHPCYLLLDLSESPLKEETRSLCRLIFASYPILVYLGKGEGEPRLSGKKAEEEGVESMFSTLSYGEQAQKEGYRFFVLDLVKAQALEPGKMFDGLHKPKPKEEMAFEDKMKAYRKSLRLNIPFALVFLALGAVSGIIFHFLSDGEYQGSTATIFAALPSCFALMALLPTVFFYADSPTSSVMKNKISLFGFGLLDLLSLSFGVGVYFFLSHYEVPLWLRLCFAIPLFVYPLIGALACFAYYLVKRSPKRKKKEGR